MTTIKNLGKAWALLILTLLATLVANTALAQQNTKSKSDPQAISAQQTELQNIKETLDEVAAGINAKDIKKLAPHFSKDFTLITLENKKIAPLSTFLEYFNNLFFGDNATIKSLQVELQIDPEPIYLDKKIAVIQGTANESFSYFIGKGQTLHTSWTAVLEKSNANNSQWQISAMHHSSGITKSMLNDLQSQMLKMATGGLAVGLILGMLIISLSRKNKR